MKRENKWALTIIGVVVSAIIVAAVLSPPSHDDLQVRECGVTVECPLLDLMFQVAGVVFLGGLVSVALMLVYGRIADKHWLWIDRFFAWGVLTVVILRLIPVLWYSLEHPCTGYCT